MKNIIWRILSSAFIIRLLLPIVAFILTKNTQIFHAESDTSSYIWPAKELIRYHKFINYGEPEIARTPGFPLLLVPGLLLGNMYAVTIVIHIVLSCLTVYIVYKIALLLFKRVGIASLCAFLYAIEPLSIVYTSKILTETSFATALMLCLYYFLKYLDNQKLRSLIISAIAVAASAYIRPISIYIPVVLTACLLLWIFRQTSDRKNLLIHACAFLAVAMGLIGCWQIRNYVQTGYWGFSGINAVNMYYYNVPAVMAAKEGITWEAAQAKLRENNETLECLLVPEKHLCPRGQLYRDLHKKAMEYIRENPLLFAKVHVRGILRTLFGTASRDIAILFGYGDNENIFIGLPTGEKFGDLLAVIKNLFQERFLISVGIFIIPLIMLLAYYLLTVVGFISAYPLNKMPIITLLMITAYFVAVSGGSVGQGRYRHPIMPIICIFAGYGLSAIFDRLKKKGSEGNNFLDEQPTSTSKF